MSCAVIQLTQQLIRIPSISPQDLGCQDIIIKRLRNIGFQIKTINVNNTRNFWAYRGTGKTLAFAGHTDVVPSGASDCWNTDPFDPVICDGILFGRGVADMKGALASMVVAVERFIKKHPNHKGRLSFLITSDEEDTAIDGTAKIVEYLMSKRENINYCLIGEPSSTLKIGDTIKNGRRGSINALLKLYGIQGHIAYPELASNPIHTGCSIIKKLLSIKFDHGNTYFSPTSINISNIHGGTGKNNIIPNVLSIQFNIRFSTEITDIKIKDKVKNILDNSHIKYDIKWFLSGQPFITQPGVLINTVIQSIINLNRIKPNLSTGGGTSDGRFISLMGPEIVELGLTNKTIHKVNECAKISDLKMLSLIYEDIIKNLML
ncbi:MAG: succinyl-diaminopimelate desuccinylase [Buchnera aphidicola (Pentalonia nigronervosa)]|uniref:Succinyl-diaminopimelate desuccinylase n=1 Tax=Buchnera aphidicola (Pentalonia nigronervosa) TaxID=1309793 RepID=A0A7H1AZD1_9GAMM|nr:MAG: succinyl-diaminopimelate desuccinylase [Buchnera aphidicola (Pentalonia nigronervosa)]